MCQPTPADIRHHLKDANENDWAELREGWATVGRPKAHTRHALLWCGIGLSNACIPLCDACLLSGTQSCGQEIGQTEDTFKARMKFSF